MGQSVLNIAHRGASGTFPENTIAAFRAAIEAGAQMCELDVQRTRDGAIVVIHDDTVDRTTDGQGAVAELTLAELKTLDAAVRFRGGVFKGERIPTLDEVFAAIGNRCTLDIELKAAGIEPDVAALMRKCNAIETSMVSSFNWESLKAMREADAAVRIGVLAEKDASSMLDEAARLGACAVNPRYDMVTPELCQAAHDRGVQVMVWTVDVPELMRLLIGYGVDGIVTNYPDRMRTVLGE
jgi:glycerophosphoryl diester phosphodiesterase